MIQMLLELAVVLAAILIGSRVGGIGLGVWGAVGVVALASVFRVAPTSPPVDVLLIILAVVVAAATMEAAGGVDYMVRIAERLIRKNPKRITFVAPVVVFLFTVGAGTGHLLYPLLPVIHEVAREGGVRPERPISMSAIASQSAICASPVSAAMAATVVVLGPDGWSMVKILAVTVPSVLIGLIAGSLSVCRRGKDLPPVDTDKVERPELPRTAKLSALIFLLGVLAVVISGAFPDLRPPGADGKALSMPETIEVLMLSTSAVIMLVCKVSAPKIPGTPVAKAGLVALVGVFGLAWLGDSFIKSNQDMIVGNLGDLAKQHTWLFAVVLALVSALVLSQASATKIMLPLGLALGISAPHLVAMLPALCALFILPVYPTSIAAVNFDLSGTTKFGKLVLNHSFMLPGLVTTAVAVAVGYPLAALVS
ncbi:anaerobic C4-dicarboxylate transporter [Nocardia sp. JMUB6875]|uniref:anaerobic C4-dicarboxylate transporter family protein n=1 Tax=Nocardia sp. JMUB6875 TaxID=3158170 RepID=UPI0032E6181D